MPANQTDSCDSSSDKPLDRQLDVYRWTDHPEMKRIVDHRVPEIEASEQQARRGQGVAPGMQRARGLRRE